MPIQITQCRWLRVDVSVIAACLTAASSGAQTARQVRGIGAVELLRHEPRAKIVVNPPLAEPLSRGRVSGHGSLFKFHESFTRQAAAFLSSDAPSAPY